MFFFADDSFKISLVALNSPIKNMSTQGYFMYLQNQLSQLVETVTLRTGLILDIVKIVTEYDDPPQQHGVWNDIILEQGGSWVEIDRILRLNNRNLVERVTDGFYGSVHAQIATILFRNNWKLTLPSVSVQARAKILQLYDQVRNKNSSDDSAIYSVLSREI